MFFKILGMSEISVKTGSSLSFGNIFMSSLPSKRVMRWKSFLSTDTPLPRLGDDGAIFSVLFCFLNAVIGSSTLISPSLAKIALTEPPIKGYCSK